jgi:drug/metabolite transporter (DMT)-like permease
MGELPPATVAFFRFAWVSVILLLLALYNEGRRCLPSKKQLPGLVALGLTGIFLNNFLIFAGVRISTAANLSLLAALNPVVTACLAAVFLKEKLRTSQMMGVVVSLLGVVSIITKGEISNLAGFTFNYGDILLVLAPICWAIYSVIGRKVMVGISPLATTAWASLIGTIFLLAAAIAEGFKGTITLSLLGWACMIYMIFGSGVLAFFWWNQGVSVVGPNKAAIFSNVIPISGMLAAAILLKESITYGQIFGALLIIGGVLLATQQRNSLAK